MHKEAVKAELRMRFVTLTKFEQARNLPARSTHDVLRGRANARAEEAIASELGKPLHVLFPARYRAPSAGDSSADADNTAGGQDAHRLTAERA